MADAAGGAEPADALSVAELNERVAAALADAPLADVACVGEVVDRHEGDAAVYFSLTDGEAKVRCVLWRSRYRSIDAEIEDGTEVLVRGAVDYWVEGGRVSLHPESVRVLGDGDHLAAIERLRRELRGRGWFDDEHKRDLPRYPERVGVVTSRDGDARHDVTQSVRERHPGVEVVLEHASVQGEGAPAALAAGIEALDGEVDVIVLCRGGGSDDDLAAFDTERVAGAVFAADTPVVAAVGHREDRTVADEVADASAITPTAAGALVAPDIEEERARLADLERRLEAAYGAFARDRLDTLRADLKAAHESLEREREHEREKREAVERAREEARARARAEAGGAARAYRVAVAALAVLVVVLFALVLLTAGVIP